MTLQERFEDTFYNLSDFEIGMYLFDLVMSFGSEIQGKYRESIHFDAFTFLHSIISQHHKAIQIHVREIVEEAALS